MLDQLDDAIRSVLADIVATTPSLDEVNLSPAPPRSPARARWLLPTVAAAVIALVVGLVALGGRHRTTPESNSTSTGPQSTSSSVATTDLASDDRYPTVAARVISRDDGATVLTIDHGSSDGIQVGMAVVDAAGLVGMVTRVEDSTSEVRLATDVEYSIECVLDGAVAACEGDGQSVNLVPVSGETLPGGRTGVVRTAGGAASLAPPDIVIGRVTGPSRDGANPLEPAADLAHLDLVEVIRYVPPKQVPDTAPTVAVTEPE